MQNKLNQIYSPAVVTWQTSMTEKQFTPKDWDENNDGLIECGTSAMLSNYTSEMNNIISQFKAKTDINDNSYYIFLVKGLSGNAKGFMPLGKNFGFVTASDMLTTAKTTAHELGHGAFNLYHTFSPNSQYTQTENTTDNLMDYSTGTELYKYQWDNIHDPERILFSWGVDESEGQYTWTPINKKFATLFNHVYENNKTDNLNYLTKIGEATGVDKISLIYTENESKEWVDTIKTFIDEWDIGTFSGDKIANSIFKKIKYAGDNQPIESISLTKNRIYIGKYTIEKQDYPVAVYSTKASLSGLTKIVVSDANKLTIKDSIKHIYCCLY